MNDRLNTTEANADLKTRVLQFQMMELPGQPMMMHMGTVYLVNDLDRENTRLTALVADLTAANAALAADNARLVTPQAAARVLLMLEVIDDIETACRDYRVQSPQFRAVMGAIARGAA